MRDLFAAENLLVRIVSSPKSLATPYGNQAQASGESIEDATTITCSVPDR